MATGYLELSGPGKNIIKPGITFFVRLHDVREPTGELLSIHSSNTKWLVMQKFSDHEMNVDKRPSALPSNMIPMSTLYSKFYETFSDGCVTNTY